jgi:DNA ligase (NAD+)
LGTETVELLHDSGLLNNIADIYDLRAVDIAALPRLGEKSADNIIRSINTSKSVPFARVLFGLGIRFVGETTAKYLAAHFKSLDAVMSATKEQLLEAEEVGEKIADAIIEYFADEKNRAIIERLRAAGLQFEEEAKALHSNCLEGKNIVISGKFLDHTRDELKELIELHGGKNQSGVSANTDFIVAGENMGPAKLQKAEKLGVKILSESDFMALISGDEQNNGTATIVVEKEKATKETQEINIIQGSLF